MAHCVESKAHCVESMARRLLVVLLLALAASAARAEEQRRTYLHRAEDQDAPAARLLDDLDDALARGAAPAEVAFLLDRLLEEACTVQARAWVVEVAPDRWLGLRAWVLACCRGKVVTSRGTRELPAGVVDALRDLQARGAAAAVRAGRRDAAEVLARFPLAPEGAAAARALLSRAIAAGDASEARAHLDGLVRLHGATGDAGEQAASAVVRALEGDEAGARRALELLRALPAPAGAAGRARAELLKAADALVAATPRRRPAAPAAPLDERPVTRWAAALPQGDEAAPPGEASPVLPALVTGGAGAQDRVVVSTGARLLVLDAATGGVVGRVPQAPDAAGRPPDPSARFAPRPAGWGGVAYAPLVLERWLAPARADQDGASDFAGRHYSLVAVDLGSGRLAWWDGDLGPRGRRGGAPPGLDDAPAPVAAAVRRGHVLASAVDAQRVYVALLPKSSEPELLLFAYERAGGAEQPLVLRPSWAAPVPLFWAERPSNVSPEDDPVAPELAATLTLDGAGRVLVTTDAGIAACVDAATGTLEWLVRPAVVPGRPSFRDRLNPPARSTAPPEPARVGPGRELAVVLLGDRMLALRVLDGGAVWSHPRGACTRVLVTETRHVVAYGERDLLLCELGSGTLRFRNSGFDRERFCGEGVACGRTLLFPVKDGNALRVKRFDLQGEAGTSLLRAGPTWPAPEHVPPGNLALTPRGLLLGSSRCVTLASWER